MLMLEAEGSHFKKWIEQAGLPIQSESHDAEIVYYTRHYKLKPGVEEPPRRGKHRSAGDLGYLKYGVFPGEDGHFASLSACQKRMEPFTTPSKIMTNLMLSAGPFLGFSLGSTKLPL